MRATSLEGPVQLTTRSTKSTSVCEEPRGRTTIRTPSECRLVPDDARGPHLELAGLAHPLDGGPRRRRGAMPVHVPIGAHVAQEAGALGQIHFLPEPGCGGTQRADDASPVVAGGPGGAPDGRQ